MKLKIETKDILSQDTVQIEHIYGDMQNLENVLESIGISRDEYYVNVYHKTIVCRSVYGYHTITISEETA